MLTAAKALSNNNNKVSLIPMLDELCLLEMTGAQILRALENGVSQYPRLEGRFLPSEAATRTAKAEKVATPKGPQLGPAGSLYLAAPRLQPQSQRA